MNASSTKKFDLDSNFIFPETVYRRELKKIRHAIATFEQLSVATKIWSDSANLRFVERESPSRTGALEVLGRIDILPPVEDWWFQAKDAFGNLREALDQLNHSIHRYVSGDEPGLVRFPMATKGSQWRDWRKTATTVGYPTWLVARYKNFQPYSTHRPMLTTLETISNKEKHREGVLAALSLSEARLFDSTFRVSPILPDDFDFSRLERAVPDTVDLTSHEFTLATLQIPGHAITIEEKEERPAHYHFEFVLRVDDEEIPLEWAAREITGEVIWAILHIIGREPEATTARPHLKLGSNPTSR